MKTLFIQVQIGTSAPFWYPLLGAPRLSDRTALKLVAQRRLDEPHQTTLQHRIVDDGLTPKQSAQREGAAERAERNRCDQS